MLMESFLHIHTCRIITTTGCPQKNFMLLWKTMAPVTFIVVIRVRGDSESTLAELSVGAEIFEFKVDPVPKLTFLNVMSGV